jgi:hypothetical protein
MRGRDAKLHHPDLGRLDRPRCDAWAMACLEQVATGGIQSHRGHLGAFKRQILIAGIGALGGTKTQRGPHTRVRRPLVDAGFYHRGRLVSLKSLRMPKTA